MFGLFCWVGFVVFFGGSWDLVGGVFLLFFRRFFCGGLFVFINNHKYIMEVLLKWVISKGSVVAFIVKFRPLFWLVEYDTKYECNRKLFLLVKMCCFHHRL